MKKLFFAFMALSLFGFSQTPIEVIPPYPLIYDTGSDETMKSVYGTGTMDYYMTGSTNVGGNLDFCLTKGLGPGIEWSQHYGTAMDEYANSICYYPSMGGLYVMGGAGFNGSSFDGMVMNANNTGAVIGTAWIYDYATGHDEIKSVVNHSGMIAASGFVTNAGGDRDFFVAMLEEMSFELYTYNTFVFGGIGEDEIYASTEAISAFFVAGSTTTASVGGKDGYVANIDPMNNLVLLDTTFGGPLNDEFFDIWYNSFDNTVTCAGYTESFGAGGKDIFIVNMNMAGETQWQKFIGGANDEVAYSVSGFGDFSMGYGYYMVTGYTSTYGSDTNAYVVKLDVSGNIIYEGYYDFPMAQIAYDFNISNCIFQVMGTMTSGTEDIFTFAMPRIDIETTTSNATCYGYNNGSATTQIIGPTYKTQYYWMDSLDNELAANQPSITGLSAGMYYVSIDDFSLGCLFSDTFYITQPDELISTITGQNVTCTGTSDGIGIITPGGGVPPYTYLWSDSSTDSINNNLTESIMYNVSITDFNGCTTSQEISVGKQSMASISLVILPTTFGDVPDDILQAELLKIIDIGNVECLVTVPVYSMGSDFVDIEPGNYMFRILVDSSMNPPLLNTYYGNTYNWETATVLEAGCDSAFSGLTVQLLESDVDFNGVGVFSGNVSMIYDPDAKDIGEPVPGAEIYLEQEPEGEPIAVTQTDEDGNYEIDSIPDGQYSLSVDVPGFPLIQTYSNISISGADTSFTTLDFYIDSTSGETGIYTEDPYIFVPTVSGSAFSVKAYPNPFTDLVNIDYILENQSDVLIELIDNTGRIIKTISYSNQQSGEHHSVIKEAFEPGNYFVKVQVNGTVYLKKIIKL